MRRIDPAWDGSAQDLATPHYIKILGDCLAARKQRNPRYSLRAFAKHIGMDPSSLSRILSGKQELSAQSCQKLVSRLNLEPSLREQFVTSVAEQKFNRAIQGLDSSPGFAMDAGLEWFERAGDAILLVEPATERILEANARACELYRMPRERLVGSSLKALASGPSTVEEPGKSGLCERRQRRGDGRELVAELSMAEVRREEGSAILVIARDITDRKASERRARVLAAATRVLFSSAHEPAPLSELARLAVDELADGCVIHLFEHPLGPPRFEVAHREAGRESALRDLLQGAKGPEAGLHARFQPLVEGKPLLLRRVPQVGGFVKTLGVRSLLAAPIIARGRGLGTLWLLGSEPGQGFDAQDRELADQLARGAGIVLDIERRRRAELSPDALAGAESAA